MPFVMTREMEWDGIDEKPDPMYDIRENANWRLMLFHAQNEEFYLVFAFSSIKQAYIIYIMMANIDLEAEKYQAQVWLEEFGVSFPRKKTWFLKVVPLDDVKNLDGPLPRSHYLVLTYQEMKKYFVIKENDFSFDYLSENGKYSVEVPVQVEEIIKQQE